MATIYIMWLREIKKFLRSRSRIIGSLGQPLLFLFALGYGLGPVFLAAGRGDYIHFLVPGVIGMSIIFTSIFNGVQMIWDKQFGFLKETLVAPVPRSAIMLGRALGGATTATMQGCIVLAATLLAGFHPVSWVLVPAAILIMLLTALLFNAFGLMIASLLSDMQGFHLIVNFLIMPLFFLSGALFPLNDAPHVLGVIARLDPLAYGVDALRELLSAISGIGLYTDVTVLVVLAVLFIYGGSLLFARIEA